MDPLVHHLISCTFGAQLCTRRDDIRDALAGVPKDMGVRQVETGAAMPSTPHLDHPRADIAFIGDDDSRRHLDVTVVSATSRQALQGGSGNKVGVSAKQVEQAKINKYKPIDVKPLVLESGGRVGPAFAELVKSHS